MIDFQAFGLQAYKITLSQQHLEPPLGLKKSDTIFVKRFAYINCWHYEWNTCILQDYPIIGIHPPEADNGLWGGETVVKGYVQSRPFTRKKVGSVTQNFEMSLGVVPNYKFIFQVLPRHWIPHFFFPHLKNVVTYSEVLDKHMKITMTERTCRLIDQHFGLDLYLLETPEIDIASK